MDFYIILGLERQATAGDIKRAYRRLARQFHPDINPGDAEAATRFRQILEAYETLVDPDRRRQYDHGEWRVTRDQPQAYGFEGFDFSSRVHAERTTTFGDLFEEVLTKRAAEAQAARGADIHARLGLSFDEAWTGGDHPLLLTRQVSCGGCAGSGFSRMAETRCPHCEGSGTVRTVRGHMVFAKDCPRCAGSGRLRRQACADCHGQGVEVRAERITVAVPPGASTGMRLTCPALGHAGLRGGAPGDLLVDLTVADHPLYRRVDDDLQLVVPVGIEEAALGARIMLPTPDGPLRLRVPPGTQSGQKFRFRDRGAWLPAAGRRGDLIVEVRVMLPRVMDERGKALLREFGALHPEGVRQGPEWPRGDR